MKHRLVVRSVKLPANVNTIWPKLSKLSTLQYIARPYATFRPVDRSDDLKWQPGEVYRFRFRLFGALPLGIHTIRVMHFDQAAGIIYTEESNPHVPVWNHKIILTAIDHDHTGYTDEVEIHAGWKRLSCVCGPSCFTLIGKENGYVCFTKTHKGERKR